MVSQFNRCKSSFRLLPTRRGRRTGHRPRCSCECRVKPALLCQLGVKQLMRRDLQRLRDQFDVVDGDVPDALLEAPDEGSIQAALECQSFLGQFRCDACHAHVPGEHRPKGGAWGFLGGRTWHPTDGWKKTCLKPRCLNIIRKVWKPSDCRSCIYKFARKGYLNTSFKTARFYSSRASVVGK